MVTLNFYPDGKPTYKVRVFATLSEAQRYLLSRFNFDHATTFKNIWELRKSNPYITALTYRVNEGMYVID